MSNKKILFEVEYEPCIIRHAYITCPGCGRKYLACDIRTDGSRQIRYEHELTLGEYCCPSCELHFTPYSGNANLWNDVRYFPAEIREVGYPDCAEGALYKKEVWE